MSTDTPSLLAAQTRRAERLLLPAAFITNCGNSFQLTASAVLVFRAQQTTLSVGWLFIAVAIPQVLLSVLFGRLADKVDRRTLCVISDLSSAATALALPIWLWLGGPANLGSYLANFGLACVAALFMPASNALIKERIIDAKVARFNANFEIVTQSGILLSAGAAGFLVQYFGAIPLFVANSGTFVLSAVCSILLGRRVPRQTEETAAQVSDGTDPVVAPSRPPLVRLGLLYATGNVVIVVINTLLTVVILQAFKQGPGMIGVVDALATAGVILGAAGFKRASRVIPEKRLALFGFLGCAVLTSVEPLHVVALLVAIPVSGFCFSMARVAARTLLMRAVPETRAGRVFGTTNAFGLAFSVAAAMVLSVIADHSQVRVAFWGLSLIVGATAVVAVALLSDRFVRARPVPAEVPAPQPSTL